PDRATKAPFRLSVSERHFWCLVFGRCGCSVKNSNERSRPPLSGECRLKRLVAGVSGYIFDECVTKCVAVLKQHGGFAPTVPSPRSKAGWSMRGPLGTCINTPVPQGVQHTN